jgi:hypothetical protein
MKLLTILLAFFMLPLEADQLLKRNARALFFQFEADSKAGERLFAMIPEIHANKNATLLAYKGAARASMANLSFNPATKFSRFIEGKNMIEEAVSNDPLNAEIRFIRLSVQLSTPSFLRYQSEVLGDRSFIIKQVHEDPKLFGDPEFQKKVLIYLRDRSKPEKAEEKLIEQILNSRFK